MPALPVPALPGEIRPSRMIRRAGRILSSVPMGILLAVLGIGLALDRSTARTDDATTGTRA